MSANESQHKFKFLFNIAKWHSSLCPRPDNHTHFSFPFNNNNNKVLTVSIEADFCLFMVMGNTSEFPPAKRNGRNSELKIAFFSIFSWQSDWFLTNSMSDCLTYCLEPRKQFSICFASASCFKVYILGRFSSSDLYHPDINCDICTTMFYFPLARNPSIIEIWLVERHYDFQWVRVKHPAQ